ncbi:MAG: MFS transporter [Gracilibacteraceae bacterium]|nr:MFS transporter [Gracilibacteraceae bacterium]
MNRAAANKKPIVGFGKYGWGIILYCAFMFFFYCAFVTDGINITAEILAEQLGVRTGTILAANTIAGVSGIVFFIIIGQINLRIGARATSGIFLIVGSLAYVAANNARSIFVYGFAACFVTGGIMSACYIAGGMLTAQWFPKTKGTVMGITTVGMCFSSAFYVALVALMVGKYGLGRGIMPLALAGVVLGVIGLVFVRNTPQERGINPDNVSDDIYRREYYDQDSPVHNSGWTTGGLLRCKELWLSAVCSAIPTFCTVGVMSQLIPRNMGLGFSLATALGVMTALSLFSIPGSVLVGLIDFKLGTKKTMILFSMWYILALLLNFTNFLPLVYISLVMFAVTTGGGGNFTVSLPASVFGRHGYGKINSVVFPIQGTLIALNFAINGFVLNLTGSVRYAYLVFVALCLVNIALLNTLTDRKFNRDYQAEEAARQESAGLGSTD